MLTVQYQKFLKQTHYWQLTFPHFEKDLNPSFEVFPKIKYFKCFVDEIKVNRIKSFGIIECHTYLLSYGKEAAHVMCDSYDHGTL